METQSEGKPLQSSEKDGRRTLQMTACIAESIVFPTRRCFSFITKLQCVPSGSQPSQHRSYVDQSSLTLDPKRALKTPAILEGGALIRQIPRGPSCFSRRNRHSMQIQRNNTCHLIRTRHPSSLIHTQIIDLNLGNHSPHPLFGD